MGLQLPAPRSREALVKLPCHRQLWALSPLETLVPTCATKRATGRLGLTLFGITAAQDTIFLGTNRVCYRLVAKIPFLMPVTDKRCLVLWVNSLHSTALARFVPSSCQVFVLFFLQFCI